MLGPVDVQRIDPMPEWGCWLELVGGTSGELGGNTFFHAPIIHHTTDGGKSWTVAPKQADGMHESLEYVRLGENRWLRLDMPYKRPAQIDVWESGAFQTFKHLEGPIHDAHIDAAGRLLLRLNSSEVWSLSANGSEWTRLADVFVPGE